MEHTAENHAALKALIINELEFLRSYPGDDKLEAYTYQVLDIVHDMQKAEKLLRRAGAELIFFPAPRNLRIMYCQHNKPATGEDLGYLNGEQSD